MLGKLLNKLPFDLRKRKVPYDTISNHMSFHESKGCNTEKVEYVRIVRHANEGFDTKLRIEVFRLYSGVISDYNQNIEVSLKDPLLSAKRLVRPGCYAFFYKYDQNDVKPHGILAMRTNSEINVGYLPSDYPVWVRNRNASGKRIISYYNMVQHPEDLSWHKFEVYDEFEVYDWVRMPLSLAIKRTDEYLSLMGYSAPSEGMSEMFLDPEDIKQLKKVNTYPRGWPVHKIPLHLTF